MACMSQEKKAKIAKKLKTIVPKGWKYSLRVRNHSAIVLTIRRGPAELLKDSDEDNHAKINHYYIEKRYEGKVLETMKEIIAALNLDNYDNSDAMTDYFDVGHYVEVQIGEWDKPFVVA